MGHQRLGVLPRSRDWKQVVALIVGGARVEAIAAAASQAAEASMIDASGDPAVRHAFWLLTQIPLAAREDDFTSALRKLGLQVSKNTSLAEITSRMMDAIDKVVQRSRSRTDFGEMAQLCAAESLNAIGGAELKDLFGAPDRVQRAMSALATAKQFSTLARDYVARLARQHLSYFLSRELSNHVGLQRRFSSMREHDAFEQALDLHCRETSRVIKEFAGEWFSKRIYEGGIDEGQAGRFVHAAFQKVRDEIRERRYADA